MQVDLEDDEDFTVSGREGYRGVERARTDAQPGRVREGGSCACGYCGQPLAALVDHTQCVADALGLERGRREIEALCRAPNIHSLEAALLETDVCGDGSCWVYTALTWLGLARHSLDDAGRLRRGAAGVPAWQDRVLDRVMRKAMGEWMRDNDWANRFLDRRDGGVQVVGARRRRVWLEPTAAQAEGAVQEVEDALPVYAPGGRTLTSAGSYGGDIQFVALAKVIGRATATYSAAARGGDEAHAITLSMPGGNGSLSRVDVNAAVRACLAARAGMSVAVHVNGNHWHAMMPAAADGRARAATAPTALKVLLDGTAARDAEVWVRRHKVHA